MKPAHYDLETVHAAAVGQWPQIINRIAGVNLDILNGHHGPCPKCSGTDRFRFSDLDGNGSAICNQCPDGKCGDGFATLSWLTGKPFPHVLADVARYLGIQPSAGKGKSSKNPSENLEPQPWNELGVATWCLSKPGVSPAAILAVGGRLARYRKNHVVIALPVWGPQLDQAEPVGWALFNISGGMLPSLAGKDEAGKPKFEQVKTLLTAGSTKGIIADLTRLRAAGESSAAQLWKVEGPSDLLAMMSLADLPANVCPITNANGAGENPEDWVTSLFFGKQSIVLHDADEPGERGAAGYTDPRGYFRPGWCHAIATKALECKHARLPYAIEPNHGKDLRDFINSGATFLQLADLAAAAAVVERLKPEQANQVVRGDADPFRLAEVNLANYAKKRPGATLKRWRGEWYKYTGTHYCKLSDEAFKAKLWASINAEFDRLYLQDERIDDSGDEERVAKAVNSNLVNNVIQATASLVHVSDAVEPSTWLDPASGLRERRTYIAMRNGLLDLGRLLEGREHDTLAEVLLPHSPNWFSTVCLPYEFIDDSADQLCPKWLAFLNRNLEGDAERIKLVQEWAGYLLLPDCTYQRFMALEGEGANGKSVYLAAITAMLGKENCSFVPLERFGERFDKASMLGKLANISADAAEVDRTAEGFLKSFTSGDIVNFDRKNIGSVEVKPTARLMLAFNNRPRLSDKSNGIWRRMLLVPWKLEIPEADRIRGMDTDEFWNSSGELPGILNWAIEGLARLKAQGRFTEPKVSKDATQDYRSDSNPARAFLLEHCEAKPDFFKHDPALGVTCKRLYFVYKKWCFSEGYQPLGERQFGKEVSRAILGIERRRIGTGSDRYYRYCGLNFSVDEICEEKTRDDFKTLD
jgi:P4 family phage/plasmid primase-like protien